MRYEESHTQLSHAGLASNLEYYKTLLQKAFATYIDTHRNFMDISYELDLDDISQLKKLGE